MECPTEFIIMKQLLNMRPYLKINDLNHVTHSLLTRGWVVTGESGCWPLYLWLHNSDSSVSVCWRMWNTRDPGLLELDMKKSVFYED